MVSWIYIIPSSLKRQTPTPERRGPPHTGEGQSRRAAAEFKCRPPWLFHAPSSPNLVSQGWNSPEQELHACFSVC